MIFNSIPNIIAVCGLATFASTMGTLAAPSGMTPEGELGPFTYNLGAWKDQDELRIIKPQKGRCSLVLQADSKSVCICA